MDDSGLWESYFYNNVEVERRQEDKRRGVLAAGLTLPGCEYPSNHLPIGAIFNWKWDESRDVDRSDGDDSIICRMEEKSGC